jgi:hypothetical protein
MSFDHNRAVRHGTDLGYIPGSSKMAVVSDIAMPPTVPLQALNPRGMLSSCTWIPSVLNLSAHRGPSDSQIVIRARIRESRRRPIRAAL